MNILEARKIYKSYGNKFNKQEVLSGIDLTIEAGEFVSIMGPSGSGKTTLLNVLSSIDHVSSGSIRIADAEMTQMKDQQLAEFRKKQLGFVFQDYNLLDTLTVKENILLPLSISKTPKKKLLNAFNSSQKTWEFMNLETNTRMNSLADKSSGHRQFVPSFMNQVLFSLMNRLGHLIPNQHLICSTNCKISIVNEKRP